MTTFGVDVSHYQSGMNPYTIFDSGFDFMIIKLSDGDSWRDPNFSMFLSAAKEKFALVAAYHWLRSTSDPAKQAENAYEALPDHTIPLILDCEPVTVNGKRVSEPDMSHVQAFERAYDGVLSELLYFPAWYWAEKGRQDLGNHIMWSSAYGNDPVGTAQGLYPGDSSDRWDLYKVKPTGILQFSSMGRVPGYTKDIDLDAFRGTRAELAATGWFKDYQEDEVTPEEIQKAVATTPIRIDKAGNTEPLQLVLRRILNRKDPDPQPIAAAVFSLLINEPGGPGQVSYEAIKKAIAEVLTTGTDSVT